MPKNFPKNYAMYSIRMILDKKQIAHLRKKVGWSQAAMARALGISNPMTISHWETGVRVPTATAMRLLFLLSTASDVELRKLASRLELIGQGKISHSS
jgi:DNA-binding transcriptional regulator YiaG